MAIDPMMLGNLKDVAPLSERERKQLYQSMQTDADRRRFNTIVGRAVDMLSPDAPRGGPFEGYQTIIWEFGNEVIRRIEARDLRKLADQVRQRGHERERTR